MVSEDEKQLKDMLWEYASLDSRIKDINIQIKLQKDTIQSMRSIGGVKLDGMPHGSAVGDPVANAAIKIVDRIEDTVQGLLNELNIIYDKQAYIRNMLSCLSDEEYRLIEYRYIKHVRWSGLPTRMHCSRSTCFNIHERAIKKLIPKNKS